MAWTMGPADTWDKMGNWLKTLSLSLPEKPEALIVISAHWEEEVVTINSHQSPPLLFDYSGFPKHTYELKYDAAGSPELAQKISSSWSEAPGAKDAHPREEHLIPLMVAAGAAGHDVGEQIFHDTVMGAHISGYKFG